MMEREVENGAVMTEVMDGCCRLRTRRGSERMERRYLWSWKGERRERFKTLHRR